MQEIERKFLIRQMPDLKKLQKGIDYERYFLQMGNHQIRIQRKGNIYEREEKIKLNGLSFEKKRIPITKEEFERQKIGKEGIQRTSYLINGNPDISLKVYHGKLEGFARIEVEFSSEEEAKEFVPQEWFGKEITGAKLANDQDLLQHVDEALNHCI